MGGRRHDRREVRDLRPAAECERSGDRRRRLPDLPPHNGALYAHVAFNPGTGATGDEEYLVVWLGNTTATPTVFAQRLDENGAAIGSRFAVSQFAESGTGSLPQVAYNQLANEYLVAWYGGPSGQDRESWGQRLSATGAEIGADVKLTSTGTNTDDVTGGFPSISYNPLAGNYLMTWTRDEPNPSQVLEVFSQVLSGTAVPQGTPTRLSPAGGEAYEPAVAYASAPGAGQYLVMWQQELTDGSFDYEMWGQRVRFDGVPLAAPSSCSPPRGRSTSARRWRRGPTRSSGSRRGPRTALAGRASRPRTRRSSAAASTRARHRRATPSAVSPA